MEAINECSTVMIGLGSNLGNREETIHQAIRLMGCLPKTRVVQVSTLRETKPLGPQDQPDYLNGVVKIETTLQPLELLDQLLAIEVRLGRVRDPKKRWGPRTIDIDILTYGDQTLDHPRLKIPHPELQNREFLLKAIHEIQ